MTIGILYIIATPIGNLEDISWRALRILKEVDFIACEDTRQTLKLLNHYQIKKPLISYHQHSRLIKIEWLIDQLRAGKNLALVSDAGTPGISDPGNKLVDQALVAGIKVVPIPGACAVTALASASGLPVDSFLFLGFVPHKKGREKLFKRIAKASETVIIYESPHRFLKTLENLVRVLDSKRKVVVGRELTKVYEEIVRGNVIEILEHFKDKSIKGEIVVIIEGSS
jgi:16S rRNA (cytidine1402-2'-O)-methyltransferase